MKEVRAFEYNGKLYRTEEEALKQELYDGLSTIFAGCDVYSVMRKIAERKDVQDELVKIISKRQSVN